MKGRILTEKLISEFSCYLKSEEKSENTLEKYLRDVNVFAVFLNGTQVTKEKVITYKNKLLSENYAVRSVNSMLASLNSLFSFLGWQDCKVKSIKLQRQIYCSEEKELSKEEYERLCRAPEKKKNERLNLIVQAICGTGIRVSELKYITIEAVKCGEAAISLKSAFNLFYIQFAYKKHFRTNFGVYPVKFNIWNYVLYICLFYYFRTGSNKIYFFLFSAALNYFGIPEVSYR